MYIWYSLLYRYRLLRLAQSQNRLQINIGKQLLPSLLACVESVDYETPA